MRFSPTVVAARAIPSPLLARVKSAVGFLNTRSVLFGTAIGIALGAAVGIPAGDWLVALGWVVVGAALGATLGAAVAASTD